MAPPALPGGWIPAKKWRDDVHCISWAENLRRPSSSFLLHLPPKFMRFPLLRTSQHRTSLSRSYLHQRQLRSPVSLRGAVVQHWHLWLPVLSLCATRTPFVTWSFPFRPLPPISPPRGHSCAEQSRCIHFWGSKTNTNNFNRNRQSLSSPTIALASTDSTNNDSNEEMERPKRKSPRKRKTSLEDGNADGTENGGLPEVAATNSTPKKKKTTSPARKKRASSPRGSAKKESSTAKSKDVDSSNSSPPTSPKKKKKKAEPHQRITDVDPVDKLWGKEKAEAAAAKDGSYTFRIASWNVAGLRAFVKKQPTALADICRDHDLDLLCLQETKLQDIHLEDPKLQLKGLLNDEGYDDYWSCSTTKKGYSGTAVFVRRRQASGDGAKKKSAKQTDISSFFGASKKKTSSKSSKESSTTVATSAVAAERLMPTDVSYETLGKEIDKEGRTIILEYPFATITNVYVPNSGQKLERLDYRVEEWDKDFLSFQQKKEKERDLPVIWLGDLNIAHRAYDIWNDGAKHLDKQAGVTPRERASFQEMLDSRGYLDAFRHLHPETKGHYSYWSQRAGNREPNKGLRLDYFVCSPELFAEKSPAVVRESYMIPNLLGSDHSPVVLEIEIKKE